MLLILPFFYLKTLSILLESIFSCCLLFWFCFFWTILTKGEGILSQQDKKLVIFLCNLVSCKVVCVINNILLYCFVDFYSLTHCTKASYLIPIHSSRFHSRSRQLAHLMQAIILTKYLILSGVLLLGIIGSLLKADLLVFSW